MNLYLAIKTLHIVSSVLLAGTGFGTAFYLYCVNRTGCVPAIATVAKLVVRADLWFTTPAVVFQPLSGIWLAHAAGWPWRTPWVVAAMGLYVVAGMCWLPVVWLQLEMSKMASAGYARHAATLPPQYWRYAIWWEGLGYPAFVAVLAVYVLMVFKPTW